MNIFAEKSLVSARNYNLALNSLQYATYGSIKSTGMGLSGCVRMYRTSWSGGKVMDG